MLRRYGVSQDDAFAVGLTCGGILDVYVEKVSRDTFPELGAIVADVEAGRPVAVATVVEHPDPSYVGRRQVIHPDRSAGSLGGARIDDAVRDDALGLLAAGHHGAPSYGLDGGRRGEGMRVFVWAFAPAPRMLVFGAIDFAAADEVVVEWPHRYLAAEQEAGRVDGRTVITVFTHEPRFDVPLLEVALRLPEVGYVGAMGSRRTHDDRMARLRNAGLTEEELARLSSPSGLDLGARTPEETAISIAAEIVAGLRGGSGQPLARLAGPIHRPRRSRHADQREDLLIGGSELVRPEGTPAHLSA